MIHVEYFWFALIIMLGIIGAVRGLSKELGVTTLLALSLFVLKFVWSRFQSPINKLTENAPLGLSFEGIQAIVFTVVILFVAFISYEGFVLTFPFKEQKGVLKGFFGFVGGLLNGYLVIGTIWDVVAKADYFKGSFVTTENLSKLHQVIVNYLPATHVNQYILLALGMILLILIVIK